MATFDLSTPVLREQFGLRADGSEIMSKLSQFRRERRPYRDRGVSREVVLVALRDAVGPLSRLDIARAIDRAKGPTVVNVLNDLMAEGLVSSYVEPYRNSGRYVYCLTSEGALYARALD
jgi:DNA-binding PadR family transcriptional regulator